jgi:YD repeat-containing protein
MAKTARMIAVASLLLLAVFVTLSTAQVKSCQTTVTCAVYSLYYAACIPPLPLGAHNCHWNGPWSSACDVPTYQCSPTPCAKCNEAAATKPIDLASGNTYIEESDIRLPGLGGGLALTRTWNSQTSGYGMFGLGWTSNVEERIYVGGDFLVKQLRGDGSIWSFGFSSYSQDGTAVEYLLAGPRNGGATGELDTTTLTITLKSGEKKAFDPTTGALLWAADRNGNKTLYSYDSSNRLVTVTDPASRHLYFTYTQIPVGQLSVSVVTSVTSDFGVSLSYQYDSLARLGNVTAPDATFVTFAYTPASLISTVTDTNGKILESHTYDSLGRGLTSSRAGGVNAVTVTYSY